MNVKRLREIIDKDKKRARNFLLDIISEFGKKGTSYDSITEQILLKRKQKKYRGIRFGFNNNLYVFLRGMWVDDLIDIEYVKVNPSSSYDIYKVK